MNPGPTTPKRNDILWELLPFHNSLSVVSNDAWSTFLKRGMHFIYLNINSLLQKIDEICYIAKLASATVIGLSKPKLEDTVLSSDLEIEGYDLVR